MRFRMLDHLMYVAPILLAGIAFSAAAAGAGEVAWIPGASSPSGWSIQPEHPTDGDMIHFSGPTPVYLTHCEGERALGGRPVVRVNMATREVRLQFESPIARDCKTISPVCGLEGSFGHLPVGDWAFSCSQAGIHFVIPFTVTADPLRTIYYVDSRATGSRDGTSWADAFTDLQSALAVAGGYSEIRVAKGVYRPDRGAGITRGDRHATFGLKNGVLLRGGFAGAGAPNPYERNILVHETVLSGDLAGNDAPSLVRRELATHATRAENSFHVVTAIKTDLTAVLDGFTIRGGHAFGSGTPGDLGAGGGIFLDEANSVIRNCLIESNSAEFYGGGVYTRGIGQPVFIECVIADNWSNWRGGGIYRDWGAKLHLERCLISGNATVFDGGGIANHAEGELILSNCILSGNLATDGYSSRGGAIYAFFATVRLNHCTFVGNRAVRGASLAFASVAGQSGNAQVRNSILWDPGTSVLWVDGPSAMEVAYSNVRGGWPGRGNLNLDPLFVQEGYWDMDETSGERWYDGDYRLTRQSPSIDAGDPQEIPDDTTLDFAGRPRRSGLAVDMGAYEFKNDPPVAHAGPDVVGFSYDGVRGTVLLDGSRSLDPEGQPLTYRWYRNGLLVSKEMQFTTELPIGEHKLTLIVNDGLLDSEPDEVTAWVTPIIPTTALISPREIDRGRPGQAIIVMVLLPAGFAARDFDNTQPMLLFPGGIEATTQSLVPWLGGQMFATARFDAAKLLEAVPVNGPVELRVVGRLKGDRFLSGTDTVRIK